MRLNKDQKRIHDEALDAIRSGHLLYEYGGGAGTGKTYTMYSICKDSGINFNNILPMAYTGAAASVMRTKGFTNATTLHSGLYDCIEVPNPDYNEAAAVNGYGISTVPKTIYKFIPKNFLPGIDLIVIDEGYMCPHYMRSIIERFEIPVLVTGDPHQLGPVKARPAYLNHSNFSMLHEIMRQDQDNPIVWIAQRILEDLPIHKGIYGNKVFVCEQDELTDNLLTSSNLILCCKNATRDYLNGYIRHNIFHYNERLPNYGERIICRKNNHNINIDGIELSNGLIGYCISQPNLDPRDSDTFIMDFIPDVTNRPFKALVCDYKYFVSPSKIRAKYIDDYATGERFEFAYAITVHLSQGSEAPNGIYFKEYLRRDMQKRLDYTAVTRFKNTMIYVLPPRY